MLPTSRCRRLVILLALSTPFGCGKAPAPEGKSQSDSATSSRAALVADTPRKAVSLFLQAVKEGDDDRAGQMLTELARRKTREVDMVVAPPGSDTATFQIGEVEQLDKATARVASTWTDLGENGEPRTDHIVWTLRHDASQWRIAGMAAKVFGNDTPIELNFEDPEGLLRQRHVVEQETAVPPRSKVQQARKPGDPFQTGPK